MHMPFTFGKLLLQNRSHITWLTKWCFALLFYSVVLFRVKMMTFPANKCHFTNVLLQTLLTVLECLVLLLITKIFALLYYTTVIEPKTEVVPIIHTQHINKINFAREKNFEEP